VAASEVRYRRLFESAKDGILILDAETGIVEDVNPFLVTMLGYSREQILGKAIWELGFFRDIVANQDNFTKLRMNEYIRYDDKPLETATGQKFDVEFVSNVYMVNGSRVIQCNIRDISERKRTEETLRASQQILEGILNAMPVRVFWKDTNLVYLGCNAVFARDAGFADPKDIIGKDDYQMGWRDQAELYRSDDRQVIESGASKFLVEEPQTTPEGKTITLLTSKVPLCGSKGEVIGVLGTYLDITERKQIEEAHAWLATAVEQAAEAIMITDATGRILYVNSGFERTSGYAREEAIGQNPRILKSGKQDAEFYRRMWAMLAAGEVWSGRLINKRKDGTLYEEDGAISPMRDGAGKIVNYVAVKRDVTREAALEKQLRQAQKMEVVGKLAGGVAHDFNNILMAIGSYCELMMTKLADSDPMCEYVQEVLKSQKRGASLTAELLAFSRKQVLEPQVFDLGAVVSNMENLLQRLIGEDIDLMVLTGLEREMVEADPNQIEQVIMNLAVNSRDAMPQGGRLTIEISHEEFDEEYAKHHLDAKPGPYVKLSVSDNGHGMDKETLSHVFEPFFTTKDKEKGTGLGLATAYGIVTQSGGTIRAYSEPDKGTTFKIYLPRVLTTGKRAALEHANGTPMGGSETILLVDDNESIRSAVGELMKVRGYNVLLASGGKEAVEISRNHSGPIDVLVTDVVMPEMSGRDLAQQVSAERAGIKVLYMSGYTDEAVMRHGILSSDSAFLQKPAPMAALLRKVRDLLD
jgi:PAS domain S-box-containing protein